MFSEHLLSKQGPLAHVWLAANYDRKLSKQQLLSTNIVKTSQFITGSNNSGNSAEGTITLRLSGQLLSGIVRIYSRKTKYLLDDVNDILYKLKNSFRFVTSGISEASSAGGSGGAAGALSGGGASSIVAITLPAQQTIVNVNSITLADQVTNFDLLYQKDLNLDDEVSGSNERSTRDSFGGSSSDDFSLDDHSFNFDQSIEYPRNIEFNEDDNQDVDLDLDFDLTEDDNTGKNTTDAAVDNSDISIELGRDAGQAQAPDLSMLDFDFDEPLEIVPVVETANVEGNAETAAAAAVAPRPKRKLVGITEEGHLKTVKRRLIVDSQSDVETGIPIQNLRTIQQEQLQMNDDGYITIELSENDKLQLINELAEPTTFNRKRSIWDIDNTLKRTCLELSEQEVRLGSDAGSPVNFDNTLDFDLSLPDLESDHESPQQLHDILEDDNVNQEGDEDEFSDNKTKSTIQIAEHLRQTFIEGDEVTSLSDIIAKDLSLSDEDKSPLGVVSTGDSLINQKREATKCFFELLVLATNDCISIEQQKLGKTEIGGNISIRSRDNLYSSFL
ncbi:putative cohesin subunit Rad21p [[Candida] railenensis]|uniref:Cohesin subunit Rad21p n=1 Tax=[Candida] railenensis TaxID=45579 RepID=A0A9P0QQU7_9ASCO|nr:putative cohesin subunit Rad21p [[Candida] railenensis]